MNDNRFYSDHEKYIELEMHANFDKCIYLIQNILKIVFNLIKCDANFVSTEIYQRISRPQPNEFLPLTIQILTLNEIRQCYVFCGPNYLNIENG